VSCFLPKAFFVVSASLRLGVTLAVISPGGFVH
jgi:hypothetical protein